VNDENHLMSKRSSFTLKPSRLIAVLVLAALIGAGLLAVAIAQSSRTSFSLNSPASFPVDI
jgi:hypothetical protein